MAGGPVGMNPRELDLDELPDGLLVVDGHGKVAVCNGEASRLLGMDVDELVGSPLDEVPGFPDPHRLAGVSTRTVTMPGNRRIVVRTRAIPPEPNASRFKRLVLLLRAEESPNGDSHGMPSADLIAIVAHELRSPLTSVRGFTSSLLAKWERFSDEQRRLMLETVAYDADRLSRLITELLDVTRIETGRLDVRVEPVDPVEVVRAQIHRLGVASHVQERLVLRAIEPLPRVWMDPDKFERIVANLVENALRHGAGTVAISLALTDGGFALLVDDDGPGVPPERREHVFRRFWRGSSRAGTGLGLYIVRGLVDAHGGTVRVEGSPTGGARFRVDLPIGRPAVLDE